MPQAEARVVGRNITDPPLTTWVCRDCCSVPRLAGASAHLPLISA
jgi:hypothetical protein